MTNEELQRWADDDPYNSSGARKHLRTVAIEALKRGERIEKLEAALRELHFDVAHEYIPSPTGTKKVPCEYCALLNTKAKL